MDNKEPKRFTSKAEITPVNPFEENSSNQTAQEPATNNKSTPSTVRHIPITTESPFGSAQRVASPSRFSNNRATPTQDFYQSPRSGRKVHYIPIYVEGSETPVIPKNIEEPAEQKSFTSAESVPSKRPSEACSFGSSVPTPSSTASSKPQSTPFSHHEREVPIKVETPVSAPSAPQSPPPPPPPQPTPPAKPDPLKQVQDVQQEVDSLTERVKEFSGASRADKAYLFLDEMLTRNLIKLDIIEVAGNEELRLARKNVIKCIQQAIALLESKVPVKDSNQGAEVEPAAVTPMDQDEANVETKNNDPAESQNQTPNTAASSATPAQTDANEGGACVQNGEKTN